ncbi:MAG: aspartyl/asparaginyl beta-hydroxylase domain-containing protein [Myxococcota bacterium]
MSRSNLLRELLERPGVPSYAEPLQRPHLYCPGLTARPWWRPETFPWVARLEAMAPVVRAELLGVMEDFRIHPGDYRAPLFETGEWSGVYFSFHGRRMERVRAACPQTAAFIDAIPRSTGINFFSRLTPGTHVMPHFGITNLKLRCHLGLVVPDGCRMRVGQEIRGWDEGKCLVFDDSYEHEVWHDGGSPRIILSVDFGHPDLTDDEFAFLRAAEATHEHPFQEHVSFWDQTLAQVL